MILFNHVKLTIYEIYMQLMQMLLWNFNLIYHLKISSYTKFHNFHFYELFPFSNLKKCTEIHIFLNIPGTNTDLALKLQIWLYHRKISSYTKCHNSDFYFYEFFPFSNLEKCIEIHSFLNISYLELVQILLWNLK